MTPEPEETDDDENDEAITDSPITHGQLVRRYLPLARDRDVMFILWEMTPYPCWSPVEELERLALVCAPVQKRGWYRKLCNESRRIYAEIYAEAKAFEERDNKRSESATGDKCGTRIDRIVDHVHSRKRF